MQWGDRANPEELTLEVRADGTATATDRCNLMQSNWVRLADTSEIKFTQSALTMRACVDRVDVLGFLDTAHLDGQGQLILTASGRIWAYTRR